jgi:hypothetical protein
MRTFNRICYKIKWTFKKLNTVLLSKIVAVSGSKHDDREMVDVTPHLQLLAEEIIDKLIQISQCRT